MNEDHIVAAILTAGLVAQNKEEPVQPKDVVGLYALCLSELIESNRAKREYPTDDE